MPKQNFSGSAIICSHVANEKLPILFAERSEPDDAIDTGWQFVCDSGAKESLETALIWALDEVLAFEPSLRNFMHLPPGTELKRKDAKSNWTITSS